MVQAKQVLYSPVDIDDAEFVDFERDPKMEEESAEFEAFKSEMNDAQFDAKITVGKKLTDSRGRPMGRQIFECFECAVDDYTFSQLCTRIREDFGTGLYQIHGRDSKGKYKFKKTVGILAPNSTDNVPANNDVGQLIDKFSDAMQRQQMATEQMFLKIAGPQTGGDAIDQIVKISAAIAPILTALGISRPEPAPPPKTVIEMLTEAKMVSELMGGNNETQYGEANGWSALTETLKALGPALGGALAMGAQAPPVAAAEAVPVLEAPITDEAATLAKDLEMQKQALAKQIGMLLIQAKGGADPMAVAEMVVNMTPPEHEERLWDTIVPENCVDTMVAAVQEVNEYREWFDNLRLGILELMSEPEESAEDRAEDAAINHAQENELAKPELQSEQNGDNLANSEAVAGAENKTDAPNGDITRNT